MLISYIVPVYNAQLYLQQCVSSVLKQSYSNIELILVNDGSSDDSGALCDQYAARDSRVRVFHKENGGVHTARNLGMENARGEYVLFLDADDWIDEETTQHIVQIAEQHPCDILRFNYIREFGHTSSVKRNTFVKEGLSEGIDCRTVYRQTMGLMGKEWKNPENFNFLATTCTSAYKRTLLAESNAAFESREAIGSFEDGLFNLRVMAKMKSFYYFDKPFYHYRKTNEGSCTAGYRQNFLQKQDLLFERLSALVQQENDPYFTEAFYNRIVFSCMELSLNAVKSDSGLWAQYREIRQILCNDWQRKACAQINLSDFSLKWKIYFFFIKYRWTLPVYGMTKAIRFLQKRG